MKFVRISHGGEHIPTEIPFGSRLTGLRIVPGSISISPEEILKLMDMPKTWNLENLHKYLIGFDLTYPPRYKNNKD